MTDFIGRTIKQYRLDSLLGDGGMGTVYKAYDTNLDRTVAVKLMHAHYARQPEFRARLAQEARTAAQLEHPSIVRIYDFGESEAGLYIAMEYIGGGSLRAHLQRLQRLGKFLPLAQTLQIGAQIAEALDYAHNRGIIHRDVKPGNIILKPLTRPENEGEQPFRAVLTDFGLVKLSEGSVMTQDGLTMGTPLYMSPEQSQSETLDGRSDLYSLGVVLYELVTNQPPFQFRTLSEALTAHIRGDMPPPASEVRPDCPPLVDAILSRMLAKDPEERFDDGEHTANVLRSAIFSLADTPTRIIKRTAAQDTVMAQAAVEAPEGYHLLIESEGRTANYMPLDNPVVNIGRDATNDMVLAAEGVSRHHARLQATAEGWAIVDLGGVNGTFVDGRRLRSNELVPLETGNQIQVGPYEITLERSGFAEQPSQPSQPAQPAAPPASEPPLQITVEPEPASQPPSEPPSQPRTGTGPLVLDIPEPIGLFLTRERLAAEPGKKLEINAEVVNHTEIDDRVRLKLEGLPTQWINLPDSFVDLPANGSAQITIAITPPRQIDTPVGRQRFHISVVSQKFKNAEANVNGSLLLAGYNDFSATLEQKEITLPNVVTITVRNEGNTPNVFAAKVDENEQIKMREMPQPIRLEPGTAGQIQVELESNQLQVFGTKFTHEYALKVAAQTGQVKTVSGRADIRPMLPVGVAYVLLITMVIICAAAGITSIRRSPLFGGNVTPTTVGLIVNTATPTFSAEFATTQAISATQMAVTISQTIQAATATASAQVNQGDRDQDGLSDEQELIDGINSDPNNPDTDGDGLSDGDEVNLYGTSPTKVDTDSDILRDNDEIFTYGTNPRLRDTDGDGLADGAEISQGSNPLDRDDPVITSGATATPTVTATATPTATPTGATPTTGAVTATPSPTFTATPTATPTTAAATATSTSTATSTTAPPTATSTATSTTAPPTATSTVAASPTSGSTIDVTPALACVAPPPTLDGDLTTQEWGSEPLTMFESATNSLRSISVYATRDTENLYLAFLISGSQANTDSLRIYIDTTNNGGDPDTSDRLFQIGRDGTQVIRAGIGSNNDDDNWADYSSSDWTAVEGGDDLFWVIEMQVDIAAELGALADPYGMGTMVLFAGDAGETVGWPTGISSNQANTWQDVLNITCTTP